MGIVSVGWRLEWERECELGGEERGGYVGRGMARSDFE